MLFDYRIIEIVSEKDKDSRITKCNHAFLEYAGVKSDEKILGHTDYDFPWAKYADIYRKHELDVLKGSNYSIIYPIEGSSGDERFFLHTKIGKKDNDGNLSHIFCHATEILNPDFNHLFSYLMTCNPKNSCHLSIGRAPSHIKLTKREQEVLFFLSKGKTAKSIAIILKLSPRTVRCHIEHIKSKLGCHTKEELIDTAIEQGYSQMLPTSFSTRDLLEKLKW